jgi:hypothetical protein
MINLFNTAEIARNLTGIVAALVLGTTLIAAAAGPAVVGNGATPVMTAATQSNIVARA